ncbi:hypothetical protein ABII15_23710 [Streptomyces sp. HUAS MG91]|uniref:Uncharacterized protein n=1 Tax=Streptomyces tabacisoli TaxID=3156398 RepID=A0AAU8IXD7_9ACTN
MTFALQVAQDALAAAPRKTTTLTAVWDSVLVRGIGVTSVFRFGTGQYAVFFDRDVSQGTYIATLGTAGTLAFMPPGEITVGPASIPNAVVVLTFGSAGIPFQDRGFHLAVHLPQ